MTPEQATARAIVDRCFHAVVHGHQVCGDCLDAAVAEATAQERARWDREAIEAIPNCSTDGDDYRMAKLAARGWRVLAQRTYADLMHLRDQVLRYMVPADARYIDALNRVDRLIRDHDTALRAGRG